MKMRVAHLIAGAALVLGCSDAITSPAAGSFRARLGGARMLALLGPSNARPFFTEDSPTERFGISMFSPQGDTLRTIGIQCPGHEVPAAGTYTVDASGSQCMGGYSRIVSTSQAGTVVLEQARAASGRVTFTAADAGQAAGTFELSGVLVEGTDSVGTLDVSGAFSADLLR
jgi:hypothetical protein